jgi:hypothetical protein
LGIHAKNLLGHAKGISPLLEVEKIIEFTRTIGAIIAREVAEYSPPQPRGLPATRQLRFRAVVAPPSERAGWLAADVPAIDLRAFRGRLFQRKSRRRVRQYRAEPVFRNSLQAVVVSWISNCSASGAIKFVSGAIDGDEWLSNCFSLSS